VLHDADRALEQQWLRLWMRRYDEAAAFDLEMAGRGLALITKLTAGRRPGVWIVLEFWAIAVFYRIKALVRKARL
jgi:hypothetical protein